MCLCLVHNDTVPAIPCPADDLSQSDPSGLHDITRPPARASKKNRRAVVALVVDFFGCDLASRLFFVACTHRLTSLQPLSQFKHEEARLARIRPISPLLILKKKKLLPHLDRCARHQSCGGGGGGGGGGGWVGWVGGGGVVDGWGGVGVWWVGGWGWGWWVVVCGVGGGVFGGGLWFCPGVCGWGLWCCFLGCWWVVLCFFFVFVVTTALHPLNSV